MKNPIAPIIVAFVILALTTACATENFVMVDAKKIYTYDSGVKSLAKDLEAGYQESMSATGGQLQKKRLAVLIQVDENGNKTDLGKEIANSIQVNIFNPKLFALLERERIDSLLDEYDFGFSGMVEQLSSKELGNLLGAELVVVGTIRHKEFVTVNSRIVDLESGEILGIGEITIDPYAVLGQATASRSGQQPAGGKFASPEKALDTLVAALEARDLDLILECIDLESTRILIRLAGGEELKSDIEVKIYLKQELFDNESDFNQIIWFFRNIEVLQVKEISRGERALSARVRLNEEDRQQTLDLRFISRNGQWKFDVFQMFADLKNS